MRQFSLSGHMVAVAALAACGTGDTGDLLPAPLVETFANPAPARSAQPGLMASPNGAVYLAWQGMAADSSISLGYASLDRAGTWSPPGTVSTGRRIIASSADTPTLLELRSGILVAAWRGKHSSMGYDVEMAHSADTGRTWSAVVSPHRDTTSTEHGFVSWLLLENRAGLVWVDGRGNANADTAARASQLAYAWLDSTGAPLPEAIADPRICNCCHTSAAAVPGGLVVVYRDRRPGELRDISAIRWNGDHWLEPVPVHDDGWHLNACPVNGPAVAARGATVAVAWFTAPADSPKVRVAFSSDTARTFGPPIEINEGRAEGRVGLVLLPDSTALVSWLEFRGAEDVLRVRRVAPAGTRSRAVDVAGLGAGKRTAGIPRLVLAADGRDAILGWTDPAQRHVVTARVRLP